MVLADRLVDRRHRHDVGPGIQGRNGHHQCHPDRPRGEGNHDRRKRGVNGKKGDNHHETGRYLDDHSGGILHPLDSRLWLGSLWIGQY